MTPCSGAAGATRSADAVDIILGRARRVEVDHVRDRVDVEAASGEVGRDERRNATRLETSQRALAGVLRHITVHDGDAEVVVACEPAREPVGSRLGPTRDPDLHRVSGLRPRELHDAGVERGRKSKVWRAYGHVVKDAIELRFEAHAEHPVGLVEDKHAYVAQREETPPTRGLSEPRPSSGYLNAHSGWPSGPFVLSLNTCDRGRSERRRLRAVGA